MNKNHDCCNVDENLQRNMKIRTIITSFKRILDMVEERKRKQNKKESLDLKI